MDPIARPTDRRRARTALRACVLAGVVAAAPTALAGTHVAHARHGGRPLGATPLLGPQSTAAPAHVYTVNRFDDPNPASATPPYCQGNAGDCSLREAVMQANADGTLDRIVVPAGTYTLTIPPDSSTNDDAASGNLNITDPGGVELDGAGASSTIVDAGAATDNAIAVGSGGVNAVAVLIQGLTVQGGNAAADGGGIYVDTDGALTLSGDAVQSNTAGARGGGIYNHGALWLLDSSVLDNVAAEDGGGVFDDNQLRANGDTFQGNTADGAGGGLYVNYPVAVANSTFAGNSAVNGGGGVASNDSLKLDHVNVTGNQATGSQASGGGIALLFGTPGLLITVDVHGNSADEGGGLMTSGDTRVQRSSFTENTAHDLGGGIADEGDLEMTGGTIARNTSGYIGGGVYADGSTTLRGVRLVNNSAAGNGGGAESSHYLTIDRSTVAQNHADGNGGGIENDYAVQVTNSTLTGNSAGNASNSSAAGGAVFNRGGMQLTNDTLTRNSAVGPGGAIFNDYPYGDVAEATINGNSSGMADGGGGIASVYRMTVQASIVAHDTAAGSASNCSLQNGITSISGGFNLESGTDCNFTAAGDQQQANPRLGPLGFHGGPTQTEPLKAGSPAINAAGTTCATSTDQRGKHRPARGACDIGAFEAQ